MIAIPTSFKLGGRNWTVEYVPLIGGEPSNYGQTDQDMCVIQIREGLAPELARHTFYHELIHAICATLGFESLNSDEDRVDSIGGMLFQFLSTKKGKLL